VSRRTVLARLPIPEHKGKRVELVLSECRDPGSEYVRFETACRDRATGECSLFRYYVGVRALRRQVQRNASDDFVRRYLSLLVHDRFAGNQKAAVYWILTRLDQECVETAS